jgi:hypothetical protein
MDMTSTHLIELSEHNSIPINKGLAPADAPRQPPAHNVGLQAKPAEPSPQCSLHSLIVSNAHGRASWVLETIFIQTMKRR